MRNFVHICFIFFLVSMYCSITCDEGFSGDTLVLTPKGYVTIAKIRPGDYVMSNDGKGNVVPDKIIATRKEKLATYAVITIGKTTIKASVDQQFAVYDKLCWFPAQALTHTNEILTSDSALVHIDSIKIVQEKIELYDLCTEKHHNFYVSEKNVNVHNWFFAICLTLAYEGFLADLTFKSISFVVGVVGFFVALAVDHFSRPQITTGDTLYNQSIAYQAPGFGSDMSPQEILNRDMHHMQNEVIQNYAEERYMRNLQGKNVEPLVIGTTNQDDTEPEKHVVVEQIESEECVVSETIPVQAVSLHDECIEVAYENGSICTLQQFSPEITQIYVEDTTGSYPVIQSNIDFNAALKTGILKDITTSQIHIKKKATLVSCGKALAFGVAMGLAAVGQDVLQNPMNTVVNVLAGEAVLACHVCKLGYNLIRIGATALIDSDRGSREWQTYTAPILQLIDRVQSDTFTVEDSIQMATTFFVGMAVSSKVLGSLKKSYILAQNNVPAFVCCGNELGLQVNACNDLDHFIEPPLWYGPRIGKGCPASCSEQYERLKLDLTIQEFTSIIKVTKHGLERLIERNFQPEEVKALYHTPDITRFQRDGAKVFIKEIAQNQYNFMAFNEATGKVVTALKEINVKKLINLGKNNGWIL